MKYIYCPLEHIDSRYTTHLDTDIINYLNENNIQYIRIYPEIHESSPLKEGMFLNAPFTINFKSKQISEIAKLYEDDVINDDDIIFFSDLWHPGIESISYLNHFCNKKVKIHGIIHAGSWTDTDEVRQLERWAKYFEDVLFDIVDVIYVASNFIKQDLIKKRIINENKIKVTPLPLDKNMLDKTKGKTKLNNIIFNGRNHPEKQPELFLELKNQIESLCKDHFIEIPKFIWTQQNKLTKEEYYKLLLESKIVVSFALQENFGYGINEAVKLGCTPYVPNRLVYPEHYQQEYLYNNFSDLVDKIFSHLKNDKKYNVNEIITKSYKQYFLTYNHQSIKTWFNER